MRELVGHLLIILVITTLVFFTNLGKAQLWDRDEPRNAGCAAEMLERGNAVVPIFNDQLRHHKPVLLYWLIMSAYSVLGVNEFSARFWSALLAVGTSMFTYAIGRRLFSPLIGLLASIALSTSMMFIVAARAATPDSVLMFFTTGALMIFVLGVFPKRTASAPDTQIASKTFFPSHFGLIALMYVMMGFAVLAKGPVGFLLPMAMIGLFGLIHTRKRNEISAAASSSSLLSRARVGLQTTWSIVNPVHFGRTLWTMRPVAAAILIVAVAAPWFVMVHFQTEGDFTRLFFVGEHFGRATNAMENHSGGLWFYPLAILLGFFPWSCFWVPTLIGVIRGQKAAGDQSQATMSAANCFLLCWVVVQVGAFSIAKTKLPSYVTPCYPALALLTSCCIVNFANQFVAWQKQRAKATVTPHFDVPIVWFYAAFAAISLAGAAIVVGGWVGLGTVLPQERWLGALGFIPLIAGVSLYVMLWRGKGKAIVVTLVVSAVIFGVGFFGFGTGAVSRNQQSRVVLDEIRRHDEAKVATYGAFESTWVFYSGKPITELIVGAAGGQADSVAAAKPRKFWEPVARKPLADFVEQDSNAALIVTVGEHLEDVKSKLPGYVVLKSTPYFLKEETIYLLGPVKSLAVSDGVVSHLANGEQDGDRSKRQQR